MKKILLFMLVCMMTFSLEKTGIFEYDSIDHGSGKFVSYFSYDDDTGYMKATNDKEGAVYYRKQFQERLGYTLIVDYYVETGEVAYIAWLKSPLDDSNINGTEVIFTPLGTVYSKINYLNGKKEGRSQIFYDSGQIEEDSYYSNGKLMGEQKGYYKSGAVKYVYEIKDGMKNGISKTYDEKGNVRIEGHFLDDNPHGETRIFYESGKLQALQNYNKGVKHGKVMEFYENGNKATTYEYVNNKVNGEVIIYNEDGSEAARRYFNLGEEVDKNGNKIEE